LMNYALGDQFRPTASVPAAEFLSGFATRQH
jgi:hypothetical protein